MSDPLIERIVATLNNGMLRRMEFWYGHTYFSGQVFPDLAPSLERDLISWASPRNPAPAKFGVMINDRSTAMIRSGASAFYHPSSRVMVVSNSNAPTPLLVHECFHASCNLNSRNLDTYDEELGAWIWQAIVEVISSGLCVAQAPRLMPLPSGGFPVTGALGASLALSNSGVGVPRMAHPLGRSIIYSILDAARPIARFLFENQITRNDYSRTNITSFPLTQALARTVRATYRQEAEEHAADLRAFQAVPEI